MTKKRDKARQIGGRKYYEAMGYSRKTFWLHPDLWYLLTIKSVDKGFKSMQAYLIDLLEREARS